MGLTPLLEEAPPIEMPLHQAGRELKQDLEERMGRNIFSLEGHGLIIETEEAGGLRSGEQIPSQSLLLHWGRKMHPDPPVPHNRIPILEDRLPMKLIEVPMVIQAPLDPVAQPEGLAGIGERRLIVIPAAPFHLQSLLYLAQLVLVLGEPTGLIALLSLPHLEVRDGIQLVQRQDPIASSPGPVEDIFESLGDGERSIFEDLDLHLDPLPVEGSLPGDSLR
jgi:hypothetical protein